MTSTIETSLSSLTTHGILAQAQQLLQGQTAGESSALPIAKPLAQPTSTSLTQNADALKAQESALSLLNEVLSAAQAVFAQVTPLFETQQTLGDPPAIESLAQAEQVDDRIRELLQSANFQGSRLFDLSRVNAQTLPNILNAGFSDGPIALFSSEIRTQLTDRFEQAFDLYA
ncbi:MAG: hypothetical protein K2Q12_09595 [Rickettsiales bacterium]|nr:hypothetical protein [Rickettsiales bacterium]